jgi:hypothetical protein
LGDNLLFVARNIVIATSTGGGGVVGGGFDYFSGYIAGILVALPFCATPISIKKHFYFVRAIAPEVHC